MCRSEYGMIECVELRGDNTNLRDRCGVVSLMVVQSGIQRCIIDDPDRKCLKGGFGMVSRQGCGVVALNQQFGGIKMLCDKKPS